MNSDSYFSPIPIRPIPSYPSTTPTPSIPIPIPPPPPGRPFNNIHSPVSIDDIIVALLERRNTISQEKLQRIYNLILPGIPFIPSKPPGLSFSAPTRDSIISSLPETTDVITDSPYLVTSQRTKQL